MAAQRVVWGIWTGLVLSGVGCSRSDSGTAPPVEVTIASVTVAPATVSLVEGSTTTLTATVTGSNGAIVSGAPVSWSSETPAVATIAANGASATVTSVAPGTATIRASAGNLSGTAQVTVTRAPVARIAIALGERSLLRGDSATATATALDASGKSLTGRNIVWSSSDPGVILPTSAGVVRARNRGAAYLTATSEGRTDSIAMTVRSISRVVVSPDSALILPRSTLTLATSVVADSGVIDTSVRWRSLVPGRATVSASGVVTTNWEGGAAPIEVISVFDSTVRDTAMVHVIDTCVPVPLTIGTTVAGRYEASDCFPGSDYYRYVVTAQTVARFELSGTDGNQLYPIDSLWSYNGFLQPNYRVRFAAVAPGTYTTRITRSDSTSIGMTYSLATQAMARLPDCEFAETVPGAQFQAVLTPACNVYGYAGVSDRPGMFFGLTSVAGRQVKITARSPDFPVYVEVVGSSFGPAFAYALIPGGTVIMSVSPETTPKAFLLYVTSMAPGAKGAIDIKIDP